MLAGPARGRDARVAGGRRPAVVRCCEAGMDKLLLLSALVVPIAIALLSLRQRQPRRALRRAVALAWLLNLGYVLALIAFFGSH